MVLSNFNVFFNGILQTKSWYVCNMLAALPFSERKREWIKKNCTIYRIKYMTVISFIK